MFVFGETQDPQTETVNLVEDIVHSQLIQLIVKARALATRRGARFIAAEDLIFLIRHDRSKVNRLCTYLSWKDVRKHAKDSNADGGGGVEVEALQVDDADDKLTAKAQKITIKLPWEIKTVFSENLRKSGHQSDDEEDEDDLEAQESASVVNLHVAKRFKEFLNLPSYLELRANDDTIDIVGFLAFEMVRSLTVAALEVKKSLEESYLRGNLTASPVLGKCKAGGGMESSNKRRREEPADDDSDTPLPVCSLFMPPPEACTPLRPEHIQDAFSRMQWDWSQSRTAGMRNWRGGLIRTSVGLI
ncbi:hypothetical protein EWM64_g10516 [Hericium alpestre]|uniref:Uncharacterized protein n=1 Tax=Hericium alpestre TaxID=135208 RepID=A0A4Y9ZFE8_9AGAM|nr:hypothetical protein EWM64_g10516 [Hericium alpestre]